MEGANNTLTKRLHAPMEGETRKVLFWLGVHFASFSAYIHTFGSVFCAHAQAFCSCWQLELRKSMFIISHGNDCALSPAAFIVVSVELSVPRHVLMLQHTDL